MREPGALAPCLHEQRHQIPLGAARVLELVNEHVVIARLQAEAALRELLHLAEKLDRLQQHVRKVEQRASIERPPVLRFRDPKHPPHAARHQDVEIAAPRAMCASSIACA